MDDARRDDAVVYAARVVSGAPAPEQYAPEYIPPVQDLFP